MLVVGASHPLREIFDILEKCIDLLTVPVTIVLADLKKKEFRLGWGYQKRSQWYRHGMKSLSNLLF